MTATNYVNVQMIHRLMTMLTVVDHEPVSLVEFELLREFGRHHHHVTKKLVGG